MLKLLALAVLGPLAGRFPGVSYHLAAWAGWVAWRLDRGVRRRLTRNLVPAAQGDVKVARAAALTAYRNVFRYYVDLCSLPWRDLESFERDHLRLSGEEHLAVLKATTPIVIVSAHTGDPELAVQALLARGRHFVALVEPLRPRRYARRLLKLRSAAGGEFHETGFGGLRNCLEALRQGGVVAVLGDRDLTGNGICVELLGRRVRMPRGPWELARRGEAVILPIFCSRGKADDMAVHVERPFRVGRSQDHERDVSAATERWARLFETHLRRDPGQWTVLEDFWRVHSCG